MEKVRLIPKIVICLISTLLLLSCEKDDSEELPNEKPTCSIMTPLDLEKVKLNQNTMILVNAQHADGSISKVEFYINNSKIFTANSNPFSFDWNTTGLNAGVYEINIIAFDDRNDTTSAEINVFVPIIDERDGNTYKIVKIGQQTWMAENLNFNPSVNTPIDNPKGIAYKWDDAMVSCPEGWHIPSDEEWIILEKFLGMLSSEYEYYGWRGTGVGVGDMLKDLSFGVPSSWDPLPNNSTLFSALPTYSNKYNIRDTEFWTSTKDVNNGYILYRALSNTSTGIYCMGTDRGTCYVRCLKN